MVGEERAGYLALCCTGGDRPGVLFMRSPLKQWERNGDLMGPGHISRSGGLSMCRRCVYQSFCPRCCVSVSGVKEWWWW